MREQAQAIEFLKKHDWECKPCNCPGNPKQNCHNDAFRGIKIVVKKESFYASKFGSIISKGLLKSIESELAKAKLLKQDSK